MMNQKTSLWNRILDGLFPPQCPFCGKVLYPEERICAICEKKCPIKRHSRFLRIRGERMQECRILYDYASVHQAIVRFKFRKHPESARSFGKLLAEEVRKANFSADCITFVPMDRGKKQMRGYNQAELLAKWVAKELNIPCLPLLEKIRQTRTQHELPARERSQNMKGAFVVKENLMGKHVLLCDDIITTGATIEACVEALEKACAEKILVIAIADA